MSSVAGSAAQSLPTILGGQHHPHQTSTHPSAAAAAAAATAADYVSYVDIKLEGIHHLPADWITAGAPVSNAAAPSGQPTPPGTAAHATGKDEDDAEMAFAFHPFRYEVTLALPSDLNGPTKYSNNNNNNHHAHHQHNGNGLLTSDAGEVSDSMAVSMQSPSVNDSAVHTPTNPTSAEAAATATAASGAATTVVAAFTRGRVLRVLPSYAAYIAAAEAPPVFGVDDAAPLRDVPAAIDIDDARPPHDAAAINGPPLPVSAKATVADTAAPGNPPAPLPPPSTTTVNNSTNVVSANATTTPAVDPPSILWVVTAKTDAAAGGGGGGSSVTGSVTGPGGASVNASGAAAKRRLKSSGGASNASPSSAGTAAAAAAAVSATAASNAAAQAAAQAAAVPGAPPPPLPDVSEAPPCVVRVPLTAAQEAYVNTLLLAGAPLELRFRRVLRAGCPSDWEDLNAGYYEAVLPIPLQKLSEPGSTHLSADVPLCPAQQYAAGRSNSVMSGLAAPPLADAASAGGAGGGAGSGATTTMIAPSGANTAASEHADRNKKRTATRKSRQTAPGLLVDEPDRSAPHPYATAGTTARLSLTFQRTLTRLVSDRIRPTVTPAQLIPTLPTPTDETAAAVDVRTRLQSTLRGVARQLSKEVREAVALMKPASANGSDNNNNNNNGNSSGAESAAWREQFVAVLQSTGQLAAFKSRLTPLVTELVQEQLRVHPSASAEDVARASNELYVQLMDMLHDTLRSSLDDGAAAELNKHLKRADKEELRWRAIEADLSGEHDVAATLYHGRLATHSGDAASWAVLWMDCAHHYVHVEDMAKAEQCYREAIACNVECAPALLDYGVWLLAQDRLDEAAVFLHGLVDIAPQHQLGWGCVGLLADLRELAVRVDGPHSAAELAQWRSEHKLALRRAVECGEEETRKSQKPQPPMVNSASYTLAGTAEERVYLQVAAYLVQLHHRDLANVCLARCRPGDALVELLYAQLFTQGGQYEEALKALEEARKANAAAKISAQEADACLLLRAECAAALRRPAEAITLYKEALAKNSAAPAYLAQLAAQWRDDALHERTTSAATSAGLMEARLAEEAGRRRLAAYVQLCNLLLADGRYKDALGAVTLALQVWPRSAMLWLGAGVAYFRAGDFTAAEECLQESNTLNPSNARTWVYLALLAIRLQHTGVEEILQQVLALSLDDAALWAELGRTLLTTALYPKLSIVCLRRASALARAQVKRSTPVPGAAALLTSTQYHLAHALMDVQQWEEAERLLSEVAAEGSGNEVLRGKAEEELSLLRAA